METTTTQKANLTIRVAFMGELPSLLGQRELQVTLPQGVTVSDLLAFLSKNYGDAFTDRVFCGPGKLNHTVLIFVNGENIKDRGGLAAKLGDGEVEVIMLPMFGGG